MSVGCSVDVLSSHSDVQMFRVWLSDTHSMLKRHCDNLTHSGPGLHGGNDRQSVL